jgi:zeta-carotene desaturase
VPLTELYNAAGTHIGVRGGEVKCRVSLETFRLQSSGVSLQLNGNEAGFDYLILALPFNTLAQTLPGTSEAQPLREQLGHFEPSPITGIHIWFDREISDLDHAVLLDRTIQWLFHKSRILRREGVSQSTTTALPSVEAGSYVELVVSSSKSLVEKSRGEIIDLAVSELREFLPAAREAKVLKSTVIKEVHATYSPRPGIDAYRPQSVTPWPRVFLAGDWTATGWPATMEGAVRSGYMAAEALLRATQSGNSKILVPDLPATGLMRLLS